MNITNTGQLKFFRLNLYQHERIENIKSGEYVPEAIRRCAYYLRVKSTWPPYLTEGAVVCGSRLMKKLICHLRSQRWSGGEC